MDIRISINDGKKHVAVHLSDAEKYLHRLPELKAFIDRAHLPFKDADKVEITPENAGHFLSAVQTSAQNRGGWFGGL